MHMVRFGDPRWNSQLARMIHVIAPIGATTQGIASYHMEMQGLMLKLSNVDAAGERALRVVAYFDQLGTNSPDIDAVVRATALIADCVAGVELPRRGYTVRSSPDGDVFAGLSSQPIEKHRLEGLDEDAFVWLERDGHSHELDEFIVERFALTVGGVLRRQRASGELDTAKGLADPALAQVLVSGRSSEAERSRAAELMGLQPSGNVQLLAIQPQEGSTVQAAIEDLRAGWNRQLFAAELSRRLALVVVIGPQQAELGTVPPGARVGAGPIVETLDAPKSWLAAREALRFAGMGITWPNAVHSETVGVLRLLQELDTNAIVTNPDVAAIARIADKPEGGLAIAVLDQFLHSGSLREAARATNFHHSSFQSRVNRIGKALEIDLSSPGGRQRAELALMLWQLTR
jgi:hypothetical protein